MTQGHAALQHHLLLEFGELTCRRFAANVFGSLRVRGLTPTAMRCHRFAIQYNQRDSIPPAPFNTTNAIQYNQRDSIQPTRFNTTNAIQYNQRGAMVLSGEAAAAFSCGRQPAESGTTGSIQPRSGDSAFVVPAKIEPD